MNIRRATPGDLTAVNKLLLQVLTVHHEGRPDLFKAGTKKYTDEELLAIFADDTRPVFVAEENGEVTGYAFCVFQRQVDNNILTDVKTLYIDDLCVDEDHRGQGIAKALYRHVADYAKSADCSFITLNVWCGNAGAMKFYENAGLTPRSITMEMKLC